MTKRQPSKTPHIKSWPPSPPRPSESPGWSSPEKDYIIPSEPGRVRRLLNLLLKQEDDEA